MVEDPLDLKNYELALLSFIAGTGPLPKAPDSFVENLLQLDDDDENEEEA